MKPSHLVVELEEIGKGDVAGRSSSATWPEAVTVSVRWL